MNTTIKTRPHTAKLKATIAALCALSLLDTNNQACTDVMVPRDPTLLKQVVSARTLDGPVVDVSGATEVKLQAFERNREWQSNWTQPGNGMQWRNPYGFVEMHAMKHVTDRLGYGLMMFDGLNEHGVSAAFLWLWATEYPGLPRRAENSLSIVDTVAWRRPKNSGCASPPSAQQSWWVVLSLIAQPLLNMASKAVISIF